MLVESADALENILSKRPSHFILLRPVQYTILRSSAALLQSAKRGIYIHYFEVYIIVA